jgi:hypothetical protein
VNDKIKNNPQLRNTFKEITMGNVMPIYMNIIFEGLEYLPSLIHVPKRNVSATEYLNMLNTNDYSLVEFYTPYAYENELVSDFDIFSPSVINYQTPIYGKCKKEDSYSSQFF